MNMKLQRTPPQASANPVVQNQNVFLKVYNGNRTDNYGKTFQIINNPVTFPHETDHVYVEYLGQSFEATIGSYRGRGETLRGASTIKELIDQNHWLPGDTFTCEFVVRPDGAHVYRITGKKD